MVSDNHTPTRGARTGDRAQLILIAAIALAFIILSIVVVFNSVLYTQTMSSSSSIETTSDAQLAELEMARGVRGIAQEVNLNSSLDGSNDLSDVNSILNDNSSAFIGQYQNASADRRPAIANVTNITANKPAKAIKADLDSDVKNSSSDKWENGREIGHFVIEFNSDFSGEINVSVSSEEEDDYELIDDGHECFNENEPIVFDFVANTTIESEPSSCQIEMINTGQEYTNFSIEGSGYDNIRTLELVAEGDDELIGNGDEYTAAWAVLLEYTYDTSELSVDREFEVEVYGDRR
ncbi:hypothetical protein [Natronoglomus mannanivorans]|uniref:Uncharacterized protein n=1 Tax=Natronoglomus mannanivorans TaxID=2979990 RepID=A0AAP2YVF1_9EURY|nr:hypothetical protein [Halobacteria archaeon AArc-xg1-1]